MNVFTCLDLVYWSQVIHRSVKFDSKVRSVLQLFIYALIFLKSQNQLTVNVADRDELQNKLHRCKEKVLPVYLKACCIHVYVVLITNNSCKMLCSILFVIPSCQVFFLEKYFSLPLLIFFCLLLFIRFKSLRIHWGNMHLVWCTIKNIKDNLKRRSDGVRWESLLLYEVKEEHGG